MHIRTIDNIELLIPVFMETFNGEPWNEHWTEATTRKALQELYNTPNFYALSFFNNEKPIGAILGYIRTYDTSQTFYIEHLFVLPDYRRQGIATKLYLQAIEELKAKGVKGSFFTTLRNSGAYNFYTKHGAIDLKSSSVMFHHF